MSSKKLDYNLIAALLYIVIGVLFCIFKTRAIDWILTVAGVLFIAYGVYCIIKKLTVEGVVCIGIGVVILLGGWLFLEVALLVFGVLLCIKGVLDLLQTLKMRSKPLLSLIYAIATIVVGVLLIVSKWVLADVLILILGGAFIVNGVLALFGEKLVK